MLLTQKLVDNMFNIMHGTDPSYISSDMVRDQHGIGTRETSTALVLERPARHWH